MNQLYNNSLEAAQLLDKNDPIGEYREQFYIPLQKNGEPFVYLCGNSLGLQPKVTEQHIAQELLDWKNLGVEGHFHAKNPWMPYHEFLTEAMSQIVGAKPHEVVVMNTLTVNLHLMMVSFYRPEGNRTKILIEADAFPSDLYAVESQIRFHGLDPEEELLMLTARPGEKCIQESDIKKVLDEKGHEIALVLIGNTNYYTGQFFDMKSITSWAHDEGSLIGFDCAHGAGNVPLNLHDSGADFAIWCTYKYLNAGPGSIAGCFVHERHKSAELPRFSGWWGHDKETRFGMRSKFSAISGAEGWQLSNPPILSMVAVKASIEIFKEVGMDKLRQKSISLTGYMEYLLDEINDERIEIITPRNPHQRGAQLSISVKNADRTLFDLITKKGVIADWRNPDVIRVSAVPMYNSYEDVYRFVHILKESLAELDGK